MPLEIHDVLPSTQAACIARAEAGATAGLGIMARRQEAGRGRQGRAWLGAEGNLALSMLLRPAMTVAMLPQWSLLAGVAVIEALSPYAGAAELRLKWPNDVLLEGAKLGGILLNSAVCGVDCAWLVIGIGVNLVQAPVLADRATARLADGPAAEVLAEAIMARIGAWGAVVAAEGFAPVRAAWRAHGPALGSAAVVAGPPQRAGAFAGLAEDGALLLRIAGGTERIEMGEMLR